MAGAACCIAWGLPWLGCKVAEGSVLMVELEGAKGFRHRVIAWHQANGRNYAEAPIGMVSEGINLACGARGEDAQLVIDSAKAVAEKTNKPLRLIVIDTMSRSHWRR